MNKQELYLKLMEAIMLLESGMVADARRILEEVTNKIAELDKKFENQEVPRPDFWGGFEIEVNYWEFWQGRRNRTHDRFCYTQNTQGWNIERMSP